MYITDEDCVSHGKNAGGIPEKSIQKRWDNK